jgi:hypothetical protein
MPSKNMPPIMPPEPSGSSYSTKKGYLSNGICSGCTDTKRKALVADPLEFSFLPTVKPVPTLRGLLSPTRNKSNQT